MSDTRSTISAAFAKAILSQENRPIRLRWSQRETHLEELLLVQRVEISEALFEGMQGHLTCLSIDPDLPLHELIGQPLGVEMVNDRGGLHHINGLITEARAGQADGALRVYQLRLRDALSVMDGRIPPGAERSALPLQVHLRAPYGLGDAALRSTPASSRGASHHRTGSRPREGRSLL